MSEEYRPPFRSAQRFLLFGVVVGLLLGFAIGALATFSYVNTADITYSGGAYPNELTQNYQNEYLKVTLDSYLLNQDAERVTERLKAFSQADKVRGLARQAADYHAAGLPAQAQQLGELAKSMQDTEAWSADVSQKIIFQLANQYVDAGDRARAEGVSNFSASLLGAVPPLDLEGLPEQPTDAEQPIEGEQPATAEEPAGGEQPATEAPPAPPAQPETLFTNFNIAACLLGVVFILTLLYLILARIRRQTAAQMAKREIKYEGEGEPPFKQWESTYTFGRDPYDESFALETQDGAFLGEAGIAINDTVPGNFKQVMDFDVWVFDKTDIQTYSRILMSEAAYNNEELRSRITTRPLTEAVLAKSNTVFTIETQTTRVEVTVEDVEYGEGGNEFFDKVTIKMNVFLQEGVEITQGEMDIPDHLQS